MAKAHEGSTLPFKTCLPVDKDTVFLAHYDVTEEESLFGIKPIGYRYAPQFNGSSSSYMVSGNTGISGDPIFTFMAWIKRTGSLTGTGGKGFWGLGSGSTLTTISGYNNNADKIGIDLWGTSTYTTNVDYPLNDWVHVAWVKHATGFGTSSLKIYVNGVEQTLSVQRSGSGTPNIPNSPLTLGKINHVYNNYAAPGLLSNASLWNVALTSQQIKDAMNRELGTAESGLVGYWKLDEGEGTIVYDSTATKNNGTLNDVTWGDGQMVATLRPGEGKYGGAIAVEESTTNIVVGKIEDYGGWSTNGQWWLHPNDGSTVSRSLTTLPDGSIGNALKMINCGTGIYGYGTSSSPPGPRSEAYPDNTVHTVSVYVKKIDPSQSATLIVRDADSGGALAFRNILPTFQANEWQRATTTWTTNTSEQLTFTGNNVWLWGVQLEQKAFPTSFVNGTRSRASLCYPINVHTDTFTLNFWAKSEDSTGFYIELMAPNDQNRVFFRPDNSTQINGGRVIGGSVTLIGVSTIASTYDWHMYTLVSNGTTMSYYQDGKFLKSGSVPLLNAHATLLQINTSSIRNGLFDELRIDKVARTAEEIEQWYYSQSPFYPKGVHRVYS